MSATYTELLPRLLSPFSPREPTDRVFVARVRAEMRDARARALVTFAAAPKPSVRVIPRPVHVDKRKPSKWTRDAILIAIHRWVRVYGKPPTGTEWSRAGEWWPCDTSVIHVFGSWANAIEDAGFPRPCAGRQRLVASAS